MLVLTELSYILHARMQGFRQEKLGVLKVEGTSYIQLLMAEIRANDSGNVWDWIKEVDPKYCLRSSWWG